MNKYTYLIAFILISLSNIGGQNYLIPLWENDVPNFQVTDEKELIVEKEIIRISKVQQPTIEVHLPAKANATGQAVIICPGGGYHILAYDWEGTDIAKWLNSKGIAGIVLKYRLPTSKSQIIPHQSPLLDAKRAMRLTRHYADEWNIDKNKIGIMGFSAGGHLASTLGTHFDYGLENADDPIDRISSRPDFMALIYPVISTTADYIHEGSKLALLGEKPEDKLVQFYSNELQVGTDTPPTFLVHAGDDKAVPVENSLVFYQALKDKGIPAEMHLYPEGGHGFSLAIDQIYLQTWVERLGDWLQKLREKNPEKENWQPLFNGKDLTGWDIRIAGREINDNYKNTFQVEDGVLRIKYDEYQHFDEDYGHLYYREPFSYYKLKFSYRFLGEQTKGGAEWNIRNSGVMIHSQSAVSVGNNQHFPVSIEIQLLGGLGTGERTTANICTPGTLFELNGKEINDHCYDSNSKTYHGDQWIDIEAVVLGDSLLVHIVEGDTVMIYQSPTIDDVFISPDNPYNWDLARVKNAENFIKRKGEKLKDGYIALQAESHPIDFKNIQILNLEGCMDPAAENYKSYFVKPDNNKCRYRDK